MIEAEPTIQRISLLIISIVMIFIAIKVRRQGRINATFYRTWNVFWALMLAISIYPEILRPMLAIFGFSTPSQLVLVFSLGFIILLLRVQSTKNAWLNSSLSKIVRENALKEFVPRRISGAITYPRLAVLIASKDEEQNIASVIRGIKNLNMPNLAYILVVDDGSKDITSSLARSEGASVITHRFNLGIGGALKTGFQACRSLGVDIIVQMDADGQHDPRDIPKLIGALLNENADMVMGSRFLDKNGMLPSRVRRMGISFYTKLVNLLTGFALTDVTTGFRAFYAKHLDQLYFASETNWAIEMTLRAGKSKLIVKEIPVCCNERSDGQSQFQDLLAFLKYHYSAIRQFRNAYSKLNS